MTDHGYRVSESEVDDPKLILIVDDDPDDVEITRRVLLKTERDIVVKAADRGEDALQFLRDDRNLPSAMLVDMKMCGMSGIEMVRHIRADEQLKHIPVIILTNSTLESDMQKAMEAGADSFIHKSFDIEQFGRDLHGQLDRWLK
ncbi:MAG: response regulator [Deltaproteobacteria bacterium]